MDIPILLNLPVSQLCLDDFNNIELKIYKDVNFQYTNNYRVQYVGMVFN
jgi:hypothetical protein